MPMIREFRNRVFGWVVARPHGRRLERWHQVSLRRPVVLRDGSLSRTGRGQVWRRPVRDGWEYEQDDCFEATIDDLRGGDWD